MRVLLSAYACEPGRGSEPAVGWNWATELANQGKEVWILTRAAHREVIERARSAEQTRMHFLFYDLPAWLTFCRRGAAGKALYYLLWQWFSVSYILQLHPRPVFDTAQHVTYVSVRFPSFLWRLGVPFSIGPISGGERVPPRLRSQMTLSEQLREWLRDLWNLCLRHDPLIQQTFRRADRIIVTSDTLRLIPQRWHGKCLVQLAIGLTSPVRSPPALAAERSGKTIRLLYAGRLIGWKGIDIAIGALHELRRNGWDARLTVAGEGPALRYLQTIALRNGVLPWIAWRGRVPESEMESCYNAADIFLFPSLRDSGGMVVLEALSHGLPVVCTDLGGPRRIVTADCGRVVETQQRERNQLGIDFADAVRDIMSIPGLRQSMAEGACRRAMDFQFRELVLSLYPAAEPAVACATA